MNKEIVFVGRMQNKTRDYIHNLEREVKLLQQENQQLHNKMDKAINYIKEHGCYDEDCNVFCDDLNYYAIPRLLEILKDSDVDE